MLAAPLVRFGLQQAQPPERFARCATCDPAFGSIECRGKVVTLQRFFRCTRVPARGATAIATALEVLGENHCVALAGALTANSNPMGRLKASAGADILPEAEMRKGNVSDLASGETG